MGRRKWCYGRTDVTCLTPDCPYVAGCIASAKSKAFAKMKVNQKDTKRNILPHGPGRGLHPASKEAKELRQFVLDGAIYHEEE